MAWNRARSWRFKESPNCKPRTPPWQAVLALPGTHLHLYGKLEARRGRKMGHLNITGADVEAVKATASKAADILGLPGLED